MAIPTVNVTITLHDQDGKPVKGASVTAKLTTVERYNGYVVPSEYSSETDDFGVCVVAVFPNELGSEGSEYKFKIVDRNGKTVNVYATIPNLDCSLHQVADLETYELRGAGEIITGEILGYANSALDAANRADISAFNADGSATVALSASDTALIHANTAGNNATNASVSASNAASKLSEVTAVIESAAGGLEASLAAQDATIAARDTTLVYRTDSITSAAKAKLWADATVDVQVETGLYSAKHHATKSAASAASALSSKDTAVTSASTATTQASLATTKASESVVSASAAATSKTQCESFYNLLIANGMHNHPNIAVIDATTASFTIADEAKLDGIAVNANNYVHPNVDGSTHVPPTSTTNNGKVLKAGLTADSAAWGTLAKADVGLGNVDNTSDANKPISTAAQTALNIKVSKDSDTGVAYLPAGTTAQRPTLAANIRAIRYNTDILSFEGWSGTAWGSIGGGAKGGGSNGVFYENDKAVTADYAITNGKNAMSAGPITVNDGVTVTIPDGSVWTIV